MNLFAYGTLMSGDILHHVIGRSIEGRRGRLPGYVRKALTGLTYPGMIASMDDSVEGIVYLDLSAREMALLDQFEGDMYYRIQVEVLADGQALCETYVLDQAHKHLMTQSDWNFAEFLDKNLERFNLDYQ